MASSLPIPAVALALLFVVCQVSAQSFPAPSLKYHGGPVVSGSLDISLLFYGRIGRVQKSAIRGFLKSLNNADSGEKPTVASWWNMVESYQKHAYGRRIRGAPKISVRVGNVVTDTSYSVGKVLTTDFTRMLVDRAVQGRRNTLAVIVSDRQVTVQEMCTGRCAQHGTFERQSYVLVGNPETECPGACAWPFHRTDGGPQGVVLQPPSGNLGADAMVMSLAAGLADAVANPLGQGFTGFGGRNGRVVSAGTACRGMFGSGAFPGYTGKIRVDPRTGGAFNAHGIKAHKFLLPALWNPATSSCWTPF